MKLEWLLTLHQAEPMAIQDDYNPGHRYCCVQCYQEAPCTTVEVAMGDSVEAAISLHQEDDDVWCEECREPWPCPTASGWDDIQHYEEHGDMP